MRPEAVLIPLSTAAAAIGGFLLGSGSYIAGWGLMAVAALLTGFSIRSSARVTDSVATLLKAVRNRDTTLRFESRDKYTTAALNEIADILHDVRRRAAESECTYSLVIDGLKTGIIVADEKGFVRSTNRAALELLELDVLTHTDQLRRIAPDLVNLDASAMSDRRISVCIDGHERKDLLVTTTRAKIGEENMILAVIDNISPELDRKEIESWSRLTRVLVHEIVNSLAPVISLSRTLCRRMPDSGSDKEILLGLNTISDMSEGLMRFAESFRAFSTPPAVSPTVIEVRPMLERLVMATKAFTETCITIAECDANLLIYADRSLTTRVISNILSNATNAIENMENGHIEIRACSHDDGSVTIDIANNGPRIEAASAQDIFVPFFTTRKGGQGIGLALCRHIMKAQNGGVVLMPYSGEGSDTVFRITFN